MLLEYGNRMLLKKIDALCGRTRRLEKHISLVLLALNSNLCESEKRLQILSMQQHMGPATPHHQHNSYSRRNTHFVGET